MDVVKRFKESWNGERILTRIYMKENSIWMANSQAKVTLSFYAGKLTDPEGVYEGDFVNG